MRQQPIHPVVRVRLQQLQHVLEVLDGPNIAHSPAVGLRLFLPGFEETLRISGHASICMDEALMARFNTPEGNNPPRLTAASPLRRLCRPLATPG
ncbi:hypothetical protein [Acidovorax sp.]|uniref:hypothetical protein n=1 Tax=Acidovorax sp. TaxID=1872122 RepID=UPI00391F32EE